MQCKRVKLFTIGVISGLVVLNAGLTGCGRADSAVALISEAKAYQQKGDKKAAIIQLKNALQKSPDNAEARYLLGTLYNETGDPLSAEKELRKALSLGMEPTTVASGLGTALYALGQYQKVLDETAAVAAQKTNAELLALRGNAYLALGKPAEAKESFERVLAQTVNYPEALMGLARHALSQRDVGAAMRFAEQAVTTNPNDPQTWFFKGELLQTQGKMDAALVAYDEVLRLKPGDSRAHLSRAALEINARKLDAARADIEAAKKASPGDLMVTYTQAVLDHTEGKHAAAWELLQQILRVAPDHMPSVMLAGSIQYALGSTQQAEQYLRKALENNPGNLYASRLLASSLVKNGEPERAIAILSTALKDAPKDPELLSLAGETYMRAGDFRKATEYFEKAAAVAPNTSLIRTALGMSRLAQGDNARAIEDLQISADLDPKSPRAGILLVITHVRNKEYDKALAAVNKLEKAQPNDPLMHTLKGGVYASKKDVAAARTSFQKALALQPTYFPAVANLVQLDVQEKNPDAAKKRLEAFLEIDKKNTSAMMALAGVASSQGRKEEATAWLERASNEKPDEPGPSIALGAHYLQIGEKAKALTLARKLHATNPSNTDVLDLLAQAQLANDDKSGALQSYNAFASIAPTSAPAQLRIASVYMRMQDETAAIGALKKALSLKPDYQEAQVALASIESRKGNHEQALSIARQMQRQAAKSPVGYELEGDILMAQKKPAMAAKAYEEAITRNKNGLLMIKLHESLKHSGKEKEGTSRLAEWIKDNPSDIPARLHLGTTSLLNQQTKAAIEQFQVVLKEDPKNLVALNNLATAYQLEKDPRALEYAEKAHALSPDSAPVLDTLGWILVEQGNTVRALPLLQKAASLAPGAPDIRYHLAAALAKSGDNATARKELAQVLDSGKTFAGIDEARALQKKLQ
jgi:putative PEP-CTERM system TPR-repeat lipoprotein